MKAREMRRPKRVILEVADRLDPTYAFGLHTDYRREDAARGEYSARLRMLMEGAKRFGGRPSWRWYKRVRLVR